jgi:hypothetical protein
MKMEVMYYSETFGCLRMTQHYNPEHSTPKIATHVNWEVQEMSCVGQQFSFLRLFSDIREASLIVVSCIGFCIIPERKMIMYLLEKFSLGYTS